MATITKRFLSDSVNGRGVLISQTATAGNDIHTATGDAGDFDEVWLWASNTSSSAVKLTIEFGGVTDANDLLVVTVAAESTELVIPGLIIAGGLDVAAFAGTTNVITVFGYVNRLDYS